MDQALIERDAQMWADWVKGDNMATIGDRHGLERHAVSAGLHRYVAAIPAAERAAFRERCLERLEVLYQDHREAARTSTRAANLVLRVVLGQAHLLGLAPKEIKVEHSGEVGHAWEPGPSVAEVLEQWRTTGVLPPRATLTRTDQ